MADEITASLSKDGKTINLAIPVSKTPKETPKMQMVASTGGFKDLDIDLDGKQLRCNLMIGYKKSE